MEAKELVPEGHFILERLVGGGFWKCLLPPALHLPKGWLSSTSTLPGCFPSCSVLLSLAARTHASLPLSPQTSLPRKAGGDGGMVPCHMKPAVLALESAASAVPGTTATSSPTQDVFF